MGGGGQLHARGALTQQAATRPDGLVETQLVVGGMTCASCSTRVEKKLGKLDGVTAAVNYATGKAFVVHTAAIDPLRLVATVEATGYTAHPVAPSAAGAARPAEGADDEREAERSEACLLYTSRCV